MKFFTKPRFGIDIGNRTLKAVRLKKKGGKIHLDKFIFYDLSDGNAKYPHVSGLDETLKALIEVAGFKNHQVFACLDDNNVGTYDLALPQMPANDLAEAVTSELESRIGFPIEEASIDHIVRGETTVNGETMLSIKAYCARLTEITALSNLLSHSQVNLAHIDVTMLSNIAMLDFNGYLDEETHSIIVDFGETKTTTALVNNKKLIATYDITTSLGTINRRLQESIGMNYLDAEKIKTKSAQKHGEEESKETEIIDGVYLDLFQNLQRSMEFFRASAGGAPISKILAIGGGSQYPSIIATMEATCGLQTIVANPFRNIEIFSNKGSNNERIGQIAAHMGTAVGLALRGIDAA